MKMYTDSTKDYIKDRILDIQNEIKDTKDQLRLKYWLRQKLYGILSEILNKKNKLS